MTFRLKAFYSLFLLLNITTNLLASPFTIHGNIKGLQKQTAYIEYLDDSTNRTLTDSGIVMNGKFILNGHIQTPTFGILYFSVSGIQHYFFFEPGNTYISGDTLKQLSVSGGKSTTLFRQYFQTADTFTRYRASLVPLISGDKAIKDSTAHARCMDNYYQSMTDEERFTEQFIRKHPDSYVSAYLLFYKFSGESNINKGIALLHILDTAIQHSKYCGQLLLRQTAFTQSATGMPAPKFSIPDSAGKMLGLADIKGKYILLDFWASWCGPCRSENPGLVKAYKKFHTQGFEILSVSLDQKKQQWLNAINRDQLNWFNVCDYTGWDGEAVRLYGVDAIPTNFLIDKNGTIVAKNLMGTGLDYALDKLLNGK